MYKKSLMVFSEGDLGWGISNKLMPSGFVKIEENDNKVKLNVAVKNINVITKDARIKLILITKNTSKPIYPVCNLRFEKGRGEATVEFNVTDELFLILRQQRYNVAAISISKDNHSNDVDFPLIYMRERMPNWRSVALKALSKKRVKDVPKDELLKKEDILSKYDANIESKYVPQDTKQTVEDDVSKENINNSEGNCAYKLAGACKDQVPSSTINPCESCSINCAFVRQGFGERDSGDLNLLIEKLNSDFQKFNPFGGINNNYTWWCIDRPVHLNNLLYNCKIRTPLLFNPSVMIAHFKYKHILAGIYRENKKGKDYLVCGIPGVYEIDDNPFGELCRWVQLEGSKPIYGSFGYWLVYADGITGRLLKIS